MTEKQIVVKYTNHLNWDNKKLTQIRDEINRLIKNYGEDTTLVVSHNDYENVVNIWARYKKEETDEELAERIADENFAKEYRRCQYEKLKREFENE